MGFWGRLFARKGDTPARLASDAGQARMGTDPPEWARAVELQSKYWTLDSEELASLETRGLDGLEWRQRLRLHHLCCLGLVGPEDGRAVAGEACRRTVRRLMAPDSPFSPRPALIWLEPPARAKGGQPDFEGELLNPSLTHLGGLEICRLDPANQPTALDFVGFDELQGVVFGSKGLLRPARLFLREGKEETVLVPALYGLSWALGEALHQAGGVTEFVEHLEGEPVGGLPALGIGIGQQDLAVLEPGRGTRLFGLGSVTEIGFRPTGLRPRHD